MIGDPNLLLQAAQSQTNAAWVQAWGSIGAIVAAVIIANHQSRKDAKVRERAVHLLARDRAMVIYGPVKEWADLARGWVRTLNEETGMGEWAMVSQVADSFGRLHPPVELADMRGSLRDFGDASDKLQLALVAWDDLREARDEISALWRMAEAMQGQRHDGLPKAVAIIRAYAGAAAGAGDAIERLRRG